ncbi:hypothetical protein ARAM_001652 [Aspergillus rambellii]|uniref:Nephrocystin 3-like N-terminal domain-containing protein n=1 Tax=Aspergillus rambellii TaxID=308745 RepID=A0A0F8V9I7_9EURO|nr:hypothetical protein ARAM_001652 [Aspergillus rambellii]
MADCEDGLPAQLHQEFVPPKSRVSESFTRYHGEAAADIVFVHGLGSRYETTWTYKRKDGSRFNWIRERLAKDMPDARILGFEYPSRWYNDPVQTDLTECASELLRSLIRDRCHNGSGEMCRARRKRPIIFVGHSFGGLVVKKAMTMASQVLNTNASREEYKNNRDLLSAMSGIIFLGTPHRGSDFSVLGLWKNFFGSSILRVSSNNEIITILQPDSYSLSELQRQFTRLCIDERMAGLKLTCYYEMREVPVLKKLVVPKHSAVLDHAASRGMNANHMDMNGFPEKDDGEREADYGHFLADIQMLFNSAKTSVRDRFSAWQYGSAMPDAEREQLQRWLDPSREAQTTIYHKRREIQQSATYTCTWIQNVPAFQEWLGDTEKRDALWITGKAGSGKSILAAYIIDLLKDRSPTEDEESLLCHTPLTQAECSYKQNNTPVLFFFGGVDRNRETAERMLATMLHQLLLARPESQEVFNIARKLYLDALNGNGTSLMAMAESLLHVISVVGPTYIIVDNIEDIASPGIFLEKLAVLRSASEARFLILSQETRQVSEALSSNFNITEPLVITDYSADDITEFISVKSAFLFEKKPRLLVKEETIVKSLHDGAHGMFQWVNSAFEHLKYVEDPRDIEQSLNGIHKDLIDTYDKIFERLGQDRAEFEIRRIRVFLQFLAVSATPVSSADVKIAGLAAECLYQEAVEGGSKKECARRTEESLKTLLDYQQCSDSWDVAESDMRACLGSVVDICSDGTLQFKHPSILRALTRIDPATSGSPESSIFKFSLEEAHLTIARICMTVCRSSTFIHSNVFVSTPVPMVAYAWNYWAYHFKKSKCVLLTEAQGVQLWSLVQSNPAVLQGVWEAQQALQEIFNRMVDGVSRDALLYLEALIDFISRPLRAVPGRFSDREYVLCLQRAQESLLRPTEDLCSLRKAPYDSFAYNLSGDRALVTGALAKETPDPLAATNLRHKAVDAAAQAKSKLLGPSSSVFRLHLDDYLQSNQAVPRPSGPSRLLLDVARDLRRVALRFAVDPIYSALLATASGSSFSPLHPLVHVAQLLEECGQYPYWEPLPIATDHMGYFICPADDLEYAPAKFVLHCFEWRSAKRDGSEMTPIQPTTHKLKARPSPSGHRLVRVSTENREQVRRLHQITADKYFAAQLSYAVFQADEKNGWINYLITNPLRNMHMKTSLLITEIRDSQMSNDPASILNHYAPTEVHETQMGAFLRSVPRLLPVYFVHYVVLLLEAFGRVARQTLSAHFTKIQIAYVELQQVTGFLWRAFTPGNLPPLKSKYFAAAVALFLLRCRYFHSWGSYFWFHPWTQFSYAYKHPAVYLDMQNEFHFWRCCWRLVLYFVTSLSGTTSMGFTMMPDLNDTPTGHISMVYAIFHSFCTIERSLFAFTAVVATLIASASVMLYDLETLIQIYSFSLAFWLNLGFEISLGGMQIALPARLQGWTGILMTLAIRVAVYYLVVRYFVTVSRFFTFVSRPFWLVMLAFWKYFLNNSIALAKGIGTLCILLMAYKAFWTMHKFIWDPYGIEDSLKALLSASHNARATLNAGQAGNLRRIGWYPLGIRVAEPTENIEQHAITERGQPYANVPLRQAVSGLQESVAGGVEQVAGETKQYFEDGAWQRDKERLGEYMDKTALETGEQLNKVVDGVAFSVGGLFAEKPKKQLLVPPPRAGKGGEKED